MSCPKGQIRRSAYTRKAYKRADGKRVKAAKVPSKCIKDQGNPGKGPKLIPKLQPGKLGQHGYKNIKSLKAAQRHKALKSAARAEKPLSVYRRLIATSTLTKNTNPTFSKLTRRDARWMKKEYNIGAKRS